jgi:hypothetical protein
VEVRKLSAFVFLVLLLANGLGFYVFYFIELHQIKMEMRESLKAYPDEKLEILTLSYEEYQNAKVEEGEIKVRGKMYDVARISQTGEIVTVLCLHDAHEDNLANLLGEIIAKPLDGDHKVPPIVVAYMGLIFISGLVIFNLIPPFRYLHRSQIYQFTSITNLPEKSVPPPRF